MKPFYLIILALFTSSAFATNYLNISDSRIAYCNDPSVRYNPDCPIASLIKKDRDQEELNTLLDEYFIGDRYDRIYNSIELTNIRLETRGQPFANETWKRRDVYEVKFTEHSQNGPRKLCIIKASKLTGPKDNRKMSLAKAGLKCGPEVMPKTSFYGHDQNGLHRILTGGDPGRSTLSNFARSEKEAMQERTKVLDTASAFFVDRYDSENTLANVSLKKTITGDRRATNREKRKTVYVLSFQAREDRGPWGTRQDCTVNVRSYLIPGATVEQDNYHIVGRSLNCKTLPQPQYR